MIVRRLQLPLRQLNLLYADKQVLQHGFIRTATTTKHGIVLGEPQKVPFGLVKVLLTVIPGLLIGAGISKNIANFLEENDLFVPSDDDDDDD
ncbi:essential MCU regulator, mitochondrial [Anthonomus grandis grandis]|uniref:essential MCU regulator, mitochondrial n=1 Tax=Anthonomus grandis grandis TaxID=2921223 RepID=UPI0021669A87|nr:essential MCU regulator, mitochondrial [Anthonomus grandis grandis]